jgi:PadR family transcriptional regulator, regulatory protein PadR
MSDSYLLTYRSPTHHPDGPLMPEVNKKNELLKGTLDMLVLQTLTVRPLHGYAIAQQIEALSEDALRVEQGSLYPALERLQKKGWITSKWGESPTGRRARYYTITAAGRRQLGNEISSFDAMLVAINRVLRRA